MRALPAGSDQQGVIYSAGTGNVLAADDLDQTLTVIRDCDYSPAGTVDVMSTPGPIGRNCGIGVNPTTGKVYTSHQQADVVSVVQDVVGSGAGIAIDITPGSDKNLVNLTSNGVIPVAILSGECFDAAPLDVASARFGKTGTEAAEAHGGASTLKTTGSHRTTSRIQVNDNRPVSYFAPPWTPPRPGGFRRSVKRLTPRRNDHGHVTPDTEARRSAHGR